jgi:peptidoglycan/LPS O-acetylase OafA/YrhL
MVGRPFLPATGSKLSTRFPYRTSLGYRPDIDGLRAVAVLSVVGFHAAPSLAPGGFVGVDVFFVISGFLISSIIFQNHESNSFSYISFYVRRINRIFPALILILAINLAFGWLVLFPHEFTQLGKHVASGAGFVSNLTLWSEAGYFDAPSNTKPLLHLWSLGIEEQFYIIWPILLGLAWKRRLGFLGITILVAFMSFAINVYLVRSNPVADFYSPIARFFELMLGGILAYLALHKSRELDRRNDIRGVLGLLLITAAVFLINEKNAFPGWWALLPTIGAFLTISAGRDAWINRNLLGSRALVWLGLISYPLYLWHWPVLSYARILESGAPWIVLVVVSIALAHVTYLYAERRLRHGTKRTSAVLLAIMASLLLVGCIASTGYWLPRNHDALILAATEAIGDWEYPGGLEQRSRNGQAFAFYATKTTGPKVLFFGDSHIEQYSPRILRLINDGQVKKTGIFATAGGCPPIPDVHEDNHPACDAFTKETVGWAKSLDIESVVIGAAWNGYFLDQTKAKPDDGDKNDYYYLEQGSKGSFRTGDGAARAMKALETTIRDIAKYKAVFLIIDNPVGKDFDPKTFLSWRRLSGQKNENAKKWDTANYDHRQEVLRHEMIEMAKRAGATVIDPVLSLCQDDACKVRMVDGTPIYKDSSHLRPFYVRDFADFIDVALK